MSYRNLEGATELDPDDPAHIMFWDWKVNFSGQQIGLLTDHSFQSVQAGDGRGVVAVSQQLFLNIRADEAEANSWDVATIPVRASFRVLFRFVKVSDAELRSLLANAVALQ
ncbi:MAG TPA: hypothetical protein EYO33_23100 [Phycisphaerales bacterium]|nr:hypothetical protein [Phycisphaerales bacterium]